jgi:hypothetical protein
MNHEYDAAGAWITSSLPGARLVIHATLQPTSLITAGSYSKVTTMQRNNTCRLGYMKDTLGITLHRQLITTIAVRHYHYFPW